MTKQQLIDWLLDQMNESKTAWTMSSDFADLNQLTVELEKSISACENLISLLQNMTNEEIQNRIRRPGN